MYDLIIIGAGPAGLSCAIEAKKAGLQYLVLDKGGIVHAIQDFQRDMFFFSTPELLEIGDIPFIVPTTRPTSLDCVNYYRGVTKHFQLNCVFYEEVVSLGKGNDQYIVRTKKGNEYSARSIVVATGYYFTPNLLNVPGEDMPNISHFYCDPHPYYNQDVLIVGGKNSAVESALDLFRHGARVTMVHRGETISKGVKYWIVPDFENRVAQGSIKFHPNTVVREFTRGMAVLDTGGKHWVQKTDFAFILIGYRPDLPLLKQLGLEVDPETLAPLHNPATYETTLPNVYIAGGLVGGRFNNKVFIENGREHGKVIVKQLKGKS